MTTPIPPCFHRCPTLQRMLILTNGLPCPGCGTEYDSSEASPTMEETMQLVYHTNAKAIQIECAKLMAKDVISDIDMHRIMASVHDSVKQKTEEEGVQQGLVHYIVLDKHPRDMLEMVLLTIANKEALRETQPAEPQLYLTPEQKALLQIAYEALDTLTNVIRLGTYAGRISKGRSSAIWEAYSKLSDVVDDEL